MEIYSKAQNQKLLEHQIITKSREILNPDTGRSDPGRSDPGRSDPSS